MAFTYFRMKGNLTEGKKMFVSVMAIFMAYAAFFILFDDYDRNVLNPLNETSDWHLLGFSLIVMAILSFLLHRYSKRMDERISREQSEQHNLLRRQLTQNIAHELKTPVASIMGYTETILDNPNMGDETKTQFIRRTHQQAKRLTALLQDISTLNRMDYAPEFLAMEKVDVAKVFAEVEQDNALAFQGKRMTLDNQLPLHIMVMGNLSLIDSIFRNLMGNAINYAGLNTTVCISAMDEGDKWRFVFKDNGVGASQEHLPRLFERFYRVDKGRSRTMGGTGLGLAIVKNAVLLHGGTITASPGIDGRGLSFDFTIQKERKEKNKP